MRRQRWVVALFILWGMMTLPNWFDAKVTAGEAITLLIVPLAGILFTVLQYRYRKAHAFVFRGEPDNFSSRKSASEVEFPVGLQTSRTFSIKATHGTEIDHFSLLLLERQWFPKFWQVWGWVPSPTFVADCKAHRKRGKEIEVTELRHDNGRTFVYLSAPIRLFADHPFSIDVTLQPKQQWKGKLSFGAEIDLGRGFTQGFGRVRVAFRGGNHG